MNEPTIGGRRRDAVAVALVGATAALLVWTLAASDRGWRPLEIDGRISVAIALGAILAAAVGAVIIGKTGNATGWFMAVGGCALAASLAGVRWLAISCGTDAAGSVPHAAWTTALVIWWACLIEVIVFFPFGRLQAIRARGIGGRRLWIAPGLGWLGVALTALGSAHGACLAAGSSSRVAGSGVVALGIGSVVALGFAWQRVRAVSGSDRAQLMPVVATASAAGASFVAARLLDASLFGQAPVVTGAWGLAVVGMPAAIVVSIVRHRAFGIFRLMGYTADFRIWTAALGLLACATVVGATLVLAAFTGIESVTVGAVTALGIGAIAWPIWRREQSKVDARFGQRQADAAATLERFAAGIAEQDRRSLRGPVFDLLAGFAPGVIVDGEAGMRFALPTRDREVGRHTFVHGAYDAETMRCAMELLAAERGTEPHSVLAAGTVLDVGANIGTSLVPLMLRFGAPTGIAVEPAPENLEYLRLNVALNGLTDRVRVLSLALSDRSGTIELDLSPANIGDHRVRASGSTPSDELTGRDTLEVPARSLDDLVAAGDVDPSRVTLVWLDVQGHEGHVLVGAGSVLERKVPIVSEFWPATMERAGGLNSFMTAVATHFTRAIDLRRTLRDGVTDELRAQDLDRLVERYAPSGSFTDLLLLP